MSEVVTVRHGHSICVCVSLSELVVIFNFVTFLRIALLSIIENDLALQDCMLTFPSGGVTLHWRMLTADTVRMAVQVTASPTCLCPCTLSSA